LHVPDAQPAAFQQAQAAAVQQPGHEVEDTVGAGDVFQDRRHLGRGQDHRQPLPPPRPHGVDAARIDLQDLLIQEQQGVEGLVLRACGHVPLDRQMAEELLDFGSAHVARVPFAVEEDEPDDPADVALLGAQGVVADAQDLADLIQKAWRTGTRQLPQFEMQQLPIEEVQGVTAQGDGPHRVLVRLGHGLEELPDLGQTQLARMLLPVEQDVAPAPLGTPLPRLRPTEPAQSSRTKLIE
jgi:hypothetical protein